jgi:hypothetical protein
MFVLQLCDFAIFVFEHFSDEVVFWSMSGPSFTGLGRIGLGLQVALQRIIALVDVDDLALQLSLAGLARLLELVEQTGELVYFDHVLLYRLGELMWGCCGCKRGCCDCMRGCCDCMRGYCDCKRGIGHVIKAVVRCGQALKNFEAFQHVCNNIHTVRIFFSSFRQLRVLAFASVESFA